MIELLNAQQVVVRPFGTRVSHSSQAKVLFLVTSTFQNGLPVQDDVEIANIFNVHFNQITNSLNLHDWNPLYESETITDPILRSIDKFQFHPSILEIKANTSQLESFNFREVTSEEVDKLIIGLDCTKKVGGPIPTKILKLSQKIIP